MAVLKTILLICALFWPLPANAAAPGPDAPVTQLNSALIEAMRGGAALGLEGRYRLLAPVIEKNFALPLMARTVAGRFWREMTAEQKELYIQKYRRWTVTSYASRFDNYRGQTFTTLENPKVGSRTAEVVSLFTKPNGEKIPFAYKVIRTREGWQIADVRVKGVSQLALTRTQFVDVLGKEGVDGLLGLLQEKIAAMTAGGKSDLETGEGS